MNKRLYFIAILPPEKIITEITNFKQYAANHFNSRHAFRSPAHITLQPPFNWEENRLDELKTVLADFSKNEETFQVSFQDFNCFAPRVIYVDVQKSEPLTSLRWSLMNRLFDDLNIKKDKYPTFHPHATIAFRDLTKDIFPIAWKYFSQQTYEASFEVNAVTLLRHQVEIGWEVDTVFNFC